MQKAREGGANVCGEFASKEPNHTRCPTKKVQHFLLPVPRLRSSATDERAFKSLRIGSEAAMVKTHPQWLSNFKPQHESLHAALDRVPSRKLVFVAQICGIASLLR